MRYVCVAKALLLVALLPSALMAAEYRCADKIISTGDASVDLLMKCGEPAWKDKREEIIRKQLDDNTVSKVSIVVEDWTYNFGPNRFVRIFTIRNGKVTDIRTGGYGN